MTSFTPNTLNGFDMVLAITEASLNDQFLLLYKTKIKGTKDQDHGDGTPEYLISHQLKLTESSESCVGITGHIECPRVDLNLGDGNDKKRKVGIVIRFLKNEPGFAGNSAEGIPPYDPKYDSYFKYWASDGDDRKLIAKPVNGWKFTFEAGLGRADIKDIEEQYLHRSTFEQLKKGVDDRLFTPSSLFCLFEAGQIAQSFQLHDHNDNPVTKDSGVDISSFIEAIAKRFANPAAPNSNVGDSVAVPSRGLPTPQNPFVLGYGLSQRDPDPSKPLPPEPWFQPQNFQFSITHAQGGFGTLNFLMTVGPLETTQNAEQNVDADLVSVPFLKRVGAATINSRTKKPNYHGVMIISAKTFQEQYITKKLQDLFTVTPPTLPDTNIQVDGVNTKYSSVNSYTRTLSWGSREPGLIPKKILRWGSEKVTVTVNSNYDSNSMATDAARRLTVDVTGSFTVGYQRRIDGANIFFDPGTVEVEVTAPYTMRFLISTGTGGKWILKRDSDPKYTSLPPMEDDPDHHGAKRLRITLDPKQPGLVPTVQHNGSLVVKLAFAIVDDVYQNLSAQVRTMATSIMNVYESQLALSLDTLTSQIVMPAPNVFTFNGLSTDTGHHVYSLITCQAETDGEQLSAD